MNKKVVQIDDYDQVELWADGKCQLRLMWDQERRMIDQIISGKFAMECTSKEEEPGIIKALRESLGEEGL